MTEKDTTSDKQQNEKIDVTKNQEPVVVKKKRGRKPKKKTEEELNAVKVPKKRGRKPKGGKIIEKKKSLIEDEEILPNIILHLKCKNDNSVNISEFSYNPNLDVPESYSMNSNNKSETLNFEIVDNSPQTTVIKTTTSEIKETIEEPETTNDVSCKEVWFKLKELQNNLHINNTNNKKSACFWCTCDFDNPPIYIPKFFINDHYEVYGCFCTPECAVSFLMNENIDSSIRFERYHLINHIYGEIYNYTKSIKPAPNPYYLLDKFHGNLSINEYRSLNNNDSLLLIVNKPLTRVMPELHEDNVLSSSKLGDNNLSLKRSVKQKNKTNIMSENFGF